jgi:hypothetical protein
MYRVTRLTRSDYASNSAAERRTERSQGKTAEPTTSLGIAVLLLSNGARAFALLTTGPYDLAPAVNHEHADSRSRENARGLPVSLG